MRPATSLYLDALRLAAAWFVFVNHCVQFWNPGAYAHTLPIAHSAVIVFFVLSGYVIAYSTLARERDPRRFALARLARLYSVVWPALALTLVLALASRALNPAFYAEHSRGSDLPRYALTACFLQNVWFFSASPPMDAPFWSLSYEFWYYALFGAAVFVPGKTRRYAALGALGLLVGPPILLLLPCWLVGVGSFALRERLAAALPHPRLAFALAAATLAAVVAWLPMWPFDLGNPRFWLSGAFVSDWITALAVGATIVSFDALRLPPPHPVAAEWTRRCADHTFSLYLYHFPLLAFATAVLPFRPAAFLPAAGVAAGVVAVVLALSTVTESRRGDWRRLLEAVLDRVAGKKTGG